MEGWFRPLSNDSLDHEESKTPYEPTQEVFSQACSDPECICNDPDFDYPEGDSEGQPALEINMLQLSEGSDGGQDELTESEPEATSEDDETLKPSTRANVMHEEQERSRARMEYVFD
jgi:hypothetical protein